MHKDYCIYLNRECPNSKINTCLNKVMPTFNNKNIMQINKSVKYSQIHVILNQTKNEFCWIFFSLLLLFLFNSFYVTHGEGAYSCNYACKQRNLEVVSGISVRSPWAILAQMYVELLPAIKYNVYVTSAQE